MRHNVFIDVRHSPTLLTTFISFTHFHSLLSLTHLFTHFHSLPLTITHSFTSTHFHPLSPTFTHLHSILCVSDEWSGWGWFGDLWYGLWLSVRGWGWLYPACIWSHRFSHTPCSQDHNNTSAANYQVSDDVWMLHCHWSLFVTKNEVKGSIISVCKSATLTFSVKTAHIAKCLYSLLY